jgi:hypothetical protein
MKYIGRFLGWILLGINLCMVVLLLVCAYSPYIDPVAHPVWSCAGLAFPAFLVVNLLFLVFLNIPAQGSDYPWCSHGSFQKPSYCRIRI